jgi:transposase
MTVSHAPMPQAAIVVDKFHVVRMASEAMERVRKSFREGLDPKARRKLMHDRFILLRRNKDLDDRQRTTLNLWTELFPPLSGAYLLKEDFYGIYDLTEKEDAEEAFLIWEKQVREQNLVAAFQPLLTAVYNINCVIFATPFRASVRAFVSRWSQ